jgi:hypothetical protein
MMAAGGYPWTVIRLSERQAYMTALEKASVGEDIAPFADFLAKLVEKRLAGEPLPEVPRARGRSRTSDGRVRRRKKHAAGHLISSRPTTYRTEKLKIVSLW